MTRIRRILGIRKGVREAGKLPSRSARLHEAIYAQHPGISCIMMGQFPNVTAYANTADKFNSQTIQMLKS